MKKTKKFLLAVLSTLTAGFCAFGVVGCGDDSVSGTDSGNGELTVWTMESVYAKAQELGYTGSLEEFIESVSGIDGVDGKDGKNGVGIEEIYINAEGHLLVKLTGQENATDLGKVVFGEEHNFGEWIAFTTGDSYCEEKMFYRICEDCNILEWKKGAYGDHNFVTVTTAPTCQAQGYDTNTCSICGKIEVTNYTAIVGHAWGTEYSYDNSYHWYDCTTCDDFKNKAEHTVADTGECSVCHNLVGPTAGVLYEELSDGTAQVVMYEGTATRVRIAETYNGAPVTKIANNAFENSTIASIVIPDSVTSIGNYAFFECWNLTSVYYTGDIASWCNISGLNTLMSNGVNLYIDNELITGELIIPDSVTSIGNYAFSCCYNLTSITIPDSVTSIGNSAFSCCSSLTSITIGDSVTSIAEYAFYYCSSLISITIPDSVTSIGDWAFYDCDSLTSITIGDSVTSIGDRAFYNCDSLQYNEYGNAKYLGNEANPYFALIEVKSKNFSNYTIHSDTKLISNSAFYECYSLTSITIGDSVTSIAEYAFYYCSSLTSITIGDSVTSIGYYAFDNCRSLINITIGDSVTSIEDGAFSGCSSLTSITFKGTIEEWKAIEKGSSWRYGVPATVVVCSDGEVAL